MSGMKPTTPTDTMSLLEYTMITVDGIVDQGLDDLENSENPIVQHMNRRVDEIQDVMKQSMQMHYLMTFMSMSVMLPIVGMTLYMFGGPPLLTGMLAMAGPLYLMNFMQDNAIPTDHARVLIEDKHG